MRQVKLTILFICLFFEGGAQEEGEGILSSLHTQREASRGAWSHDPVIMT